MASIVLKKRNFSQMLESTHLLEEPTIDPKRFLDEQGNFAKSFNHYLERLSIMFPELSPDQLSQELSSNGNDVISTIENLKNRSKAENSENPGIRNLGQTTPAFSPPQNGVLDIHREIEGTLTELAACQDADLARRHLLDFAKKVRAQPGTRLDEQQEKKLLAENQILKRAFKVQQKQLIAAKQESEKIIVGWSQFQSEFESLKKVNFILNNKIKDLESTSCNRLNFGNRPIY